MRSMPRAKANEIEIEHEEFGSPGDPALVLVMGFSLQMIDWDTTFCESLASRGFFVVRFDNRDVGLSTKIEGGPATDIPAILAGDTSSVAYSLDDMADDTAGLLDALDMRAAHLVGMSMGGMIAQLVTLRHPARVRSLCSIMSTTGNRSVGQPSPELVPLLLTPPPKEREANVEHGLAVWRLLCSPARTFDEARMRRRLEQSYDRAYYPPGAKRQIGAMLSARDRTSELAKVRAPTLVLHGEHDKLIAPSGGEATARAIAGAELRIFPNMGHELPPDLWPEIIDAIVRNAARSGD
jgi:pimeloyl-ACP methyl ester carboxylesterase